MTQQKIGILGSGHVGQALGSGFVGLGLDVKMGSREANNPNVQEWVAKQGKHASAGTFAEAAAFGDVVVLCTLWTGTENALQLAGAKNLAGKVVIDVTNPLKHVGNAPPTLALGTDDSGGEQVQRWLPQSHVVKAFNTVGAAHMVNPRFPNGPPDMFICGNDADARKTVSEICKSFGWGVVELGGIDGARVLEPMCILWVKYGVMTGTWNHAFRLVRQ